MPLPVLAGNADTAEPMCQDSVTRSKSTPPPQSNQTTISADDSSTKGNKFILDGHVVISGQDQSLQADRITYDKSTGDAELHGNIQLRQEDLTILATEGQANTKNKTARFNKLEYELNRYSGRGSAATAELSGKQSAKLTKITYTTCKKPKVDWVIKADRVTLDQKDETAIAKNVSIIFKGLPIFYFPKFSFPIGDKRKSGFLTPGFGQSSKTGTEFDIPLYWNIAPDRDATFNLRTMSKRGAQIGLEYRQLHKNAFSTVRLEYLEDSDFNDNRYFSSAQHNGRYFDDWKLRADLNYVSDQQYFDDLRQGFNISGITQLPRLVEIRRDNQNGYLLARAHEFQSIQTPNSYQRLPQLSIDLASSNPAHQLRYNLKSDLTQFDHRNNLTTGTRLDILPSLEFDWTSNAYYVRPKVMYRYTDYQLNNPVAGQPDSISRNIPIASFESGLFFERPLAISGRSNILTLEPRLYYLYAKHDNQSSIPIFDTTLPDFQFADLFRYNRFTGPDRQSDANQLTLAISSRLIDQQKGLEWLRLSIGQILYFDDRQITLPGQTTETSNTSDFVAELEGQISDRGHFRISGLWDTDQNQVDKGNVSYQYRIDDKHHMSLGYRYQRNLIEQTDISGRWKLSPRWHAIGKWSYSLRDKENIDSLLGMEYETCCWSIQFAARHHLDTDGTGINNAFYIQLNLKGIGNIGKNIDDFLDNTKFGYISRSTVQ